MTAVGLVSHVDGYIIGTCTPFLVDGRSTTIHMVPDNPYAVFNQSFSDNVSVSPEYRNRARTFSANIKAWSFSADTPDQLIVIEHKGDIVPHVDENQYYDTVTGTYSLVRHYHAIELTSFRLTKHIAGFKVYEDMDVHIRDVYGVTARNARNNVESLQEQYMLQQQHAHQLIQRTLEAMRTDGAISEELLEHIKEFSGRDVGELQKYVTVPEPLAEAGHTTTRRIHLDD